MAKTVKNAKEKTAAKPKAKPKAASSRKRKGEEMNPFESTPDPGQSSILSFADTTASKKVPPAGVQQEAVEVSSKPPSAEVPVEQLPIETSSLTEVPLTEEMSLVDAGSDLSLKNSDEVQPLQLETTPAVESNDTRVEAQHEEMNTQDEMTTAPQVPSPNGDNDVATQGEVSQYGIKPDVLPGQDFTADVTMPSTYDDPFHMLVSGSSITLGAVVDVARTCVSKYIGQEWKQAVHSFIEKQDEDIFCALIQECQKHPLFTEHCEDVISSAGVDGNEWVFGSGDGDPLEDLCDMVCWLVGKDPTGTTVMHETTETLSDVPSAYVHVDTEEHPKVFGLQYGVELGQIHHK